MTEADCKLITEKLLGECWHLDIYGDSLDIICSVCCQRVGIHPRRTFTTPQDFFACFEKLVELGEWGDFWMIARKNFIITTSIQIDDFVSWDEWLLSRTESGHMRLCVLCAEWLRKENKDGHQ
jgi:hypothetical protein